MVIYRLLRPQRVFEPRSQFSNTHLLRKSIHARPVSFRVLQAMVVVGIYTLLPALETLALEYPTRARPTTPTTQAVSSELWFGVVFIKLFRGLGDFYLASTLMFNKPRIRDVNKPEQQIPYPLAHILSSLFLSMKHAWRHDPKEVVLLGESTMSERAALRCLVAWVSFNSTRLPYPPGLGSRSIRSGCLSHPGS
ncbi:hypothetical protein EX30DRAFT_72626 [Ascodesmis nigricans]|uniref:Uncharacterized protein n=1 Tax=Ascodesmis nigricans TaxID=341454 RepID=A0A4S2MTZ7_9PEZI|nr:hypothetical protein EX30DRAFT_72626 [Ascodesmis nigricans]